MPAFFFAKLSGPDRSVDLDDYSIREDTRLGISLLFCLMVKNNLKTRPPPFSGLGAIRRLLTQLEFAVGETIKLLPPPITCGHRITDPQDTLSWFIPFVGWRYRRELLHVSCFTMSPARPPPGLTPAHPGASRRIPAHLGTPRRISAHLGASRRLPVHLGASRRLSVHLGGVRPAHPRFPSHSRQPSPPSQFPSPQLLFPCLPLRSSLAILLPRSSTPPPYTYLTIKLFPLYIGPNDLRKPQIS